jgi:hypothetical protein
MEIADRNEKPWLDMRLFNEERSIGFESRAIFGNNVLYIIIGISGSIFIILNQIRLRTQKWKMWLTMRFILVVCCVSIPLFVILFFQAGKASILPPPLHGVTLQQWGCCTQGIILPRVQVTGLIEQLRKASEAPDLIVDHYARDSGLARYALHPVQVQHLGKSI